MSALFLLHCPFVLARFCCFCFCDLLIGWNLLSERDRFVRFADVATGKSFIDCTNGFVHALMVCCGAGPIFAGSDFLFCIVFGIQFLAVVFDCFALASIGCSMFAGVVMGIDSWLENCRFSTSCTDNGAHAFARGIGARFLAIEALLRLFHTWHHSEAPVPSAISGGLFPPCQNYHHHVCVYCQLCVVVPLCHPCGL